MVVFAPDFPSIGTLETSSHQASAALNPRLILRSTPPLDWGKSVRESRISEVSEPLVKRIHVNIVDLLAFAEPPPTGDSGGEENSLQEVH